MAARGGKRLKSKQETWPEHLLLPILSTLPAKSLLRFKSVSKHWRSLISSPDFIEDHLENQQKKEYPQLIVADTGYNGVVALESVAIVDVEVKEGVKIRKVFQRNSLDISHLPPDVNRMANSCDGILCFFGENNIFVYNPGTTEYRILQIEKRSYSLVTYYYDCFGQSVSVHHFVGFGRDQVTKEWKIIQLLRPNREEEGHILECEVFTLSSNAGASWRGIGEVAYFIRLPQTPAYVNGALHWILDGRHANPSEVIVSFDLHTEKFQAISQPSCFSEASSVIRRCRVSRLLSLRSSLCLIEPELGLQLNIWVMNRSNGIWEKLFCIDWESLSPLPFPIAEFKDGTFFVYRYGVDLRIYYPESKSFSEVLLRCERRGVPSAYTESLVPIYGQPLLY